MDSFDHEEAESIAQNWVQNLRCRFAKLGLNYAYDSQVFKGYDHGRKSVENNGECLPNCRIPLSSEEKGVLTDSVRNKSGTLKATEAKHNVDLANVDDHDALENIDRDTLTSARSARSVYLESLREKRLNFFERKVASLTTGSDEKETLKTCGVVDKSTNFEGFQKVLKNESTEILNGEWYKNSTSLAKFNSNNESSFLNKQPTVLDDSNGSKFKDKHISVSLSTPSSVRSSEKVSWDNSKFDAVDSSDGDENFDVGLQSTKQEVLLSLPHLTYESNSDSDFTLDDPVSRHTSPGVDSPIWGKFQKNSSAMLPLAQSTSPPVPQITGALYHEFSGGDKEFDSLKTIDESSNARQRPRSLSHPSTARDCLEMCGTYSCGCPNESVDVVCNVSKDSGDVEISYGDSYNSKKHIMSDNWVSSSKHSSSELTYDSVVNSFVNAPKCYGESDHIISNDWLNSKKLSSLKHDNLIPVKSSESFLNLPSENVQSVSVLYNDVCVCPECDKVNSSQSTWCLECGTSLLSVKPFSSKAFDLCSETMKAKTPLIKSGQNVSETNQNEVSGEQDPKKPVPVLRGTLDSRNGQPRKNRPKHNGRRWEKSNLAWSSFKDSHLAKPPSGKTSKSNPRKSSVREIADGPRPRAASFQNLGKRAVKADARNGPGSLPKSYRFREFKSKMAKSSDSVSADLISKGKKDAEKNENHATGKNKKSDSTQYDEITEMIRTHRVKREPYLCLPDEIILRIFCHLSHSDLARCARVCQQLQRIALDDLLWRTIVLNRSQNISDEILEKIGSKKPVSLSLIRCRGKLVTSGGLRELFRRCAENLEELNFIGCNGGQLIGESILFHVALRCNKLRSVDASWSNVGDNGVEALVQNVERLECLCLNGCQAITDHSLKVVADKHGNSLTTFEIFGCFNVSATAIKRLGQKCPNLETLNLGQCYKITSSDIGRLVSHLKSIVNLDLRGCKQARDACVKIIVKHCPHLVNFVLANCPLITDIAMAEIATNLTAVRCLDVCGCVKVTDHGVRALARSCNRLNSLDLSSTSITQKSVMLLANYCSQNLQSLKLSFCVDVTDDSVCRLVKHCKRMKTLHLYGCKRLRNVKALQDLNQSLKLEF